MGSPVQRRQQGSDDARQNPAPNPNWQHRPERIPKSPYLTLTNGEASAMRSPHTSVCSGSVSDFREATSCCKIVPEKRTDERASATPDAVSIKRTAQEGIRVPVLRPKVRDKGKGTCRPIQSSNEPVRDAPLSSLEDRNKPLVALREAYFSKSSAVMLQEPWCQTQSAEINLTCTTSKSQLVQLPLQNETYYPGNLDLYHPLNPNLPRSSPSACVTIDFEKVSGLVHEALEVSCPKPSTSVLSPDLNRVPNIDPSYPPPASEILEFNTCSEDDESESHDEGQKINQPFDVYNPTENVLQEIVHTELETHQPTLACSISDLLVNQTKKGTNKDIVSFVETLRTNPDESSILIERAAQEVLVIDRKEQKQCQRCETYGFSELIKRLLYSELHARVATRHPWLAENIADVLIDNNLLEVLHLLLHPNLLLQTMMETVNGAMKLLNARQRRKVLRQDMNIRLQAIQSEKHHKVLAIIMREKDITLLNMLSYPELLESRAREALTVVRFNEHRARLKRVVRKQEMAQANISLRHSSGRQTVVASEPGNLQLRGQHGAGTPGRKLTVPRAAVAKTAVPAVKRRRIGDN